MMATGILEIPGSEKQTFSNQHGEEIDFSWLPIGSVCLSIIGILTGALWVVAPVQKETNWFVGKITFLPIFFFRMLAWEIILIILDSFSLFIFLGFALLNWIVLLFVQDQFILEPINHALLSLIFPVFKLPSTKVEDTNSFKILFWMILTGNLFFLIVHGCLVLVYHYDIYNPWCKGDTDKLLISEEMFQNIHWTLISLCAAATFPTLVSYSIKLMR